MDTQTINGITSELAIRLANSEIDRASFKTQVQQLTNENEQLKKQIDELRNNDKKGPTNK